MIFQEVTKSARTTAACQILRDYEPFQDLPLCKVAIAFLMLTLATRTWLFGIPDFSKAHSGNDHRHLQLRPRGNQRLPILWCDDTVIGVNVQDTELAKHNFLLSGNIMECALESCVEHLSPILASKGQWLKQAR